MTITYVDLEKNTVDWDVDRFPEENLIDWTVPTRDGSEVKLANYRWKSTKGEAPKAVLIMFHGYGSWTGKYGYYAKPLAEAGYDVVGYDLKGFGNSIPYPAGELDEFPDLIEEAYAYT